MGHGTHHRDRSRTGASTAGYGRRLGGSRQPSAVRRRFRRQSRLGWGRVRTSGAERYRAPGVRSRRLAEAVHLRVSEPGAVQPTAGGGNPPQPGGDLAVAPRGAFKPAGIAPPQGPVATQQGAWHQRIDDNPLTAQIPGFSHRKILLGPTFHKVSNVYATIRLQHVLKCSVVNIDSAAIFATSE